MAKNFFKTSKGLSIGSLTAPPADPQVGDIYYDTTLNQFQRYENGAWGSFGSGSGAVLETDAVLTTSLADVSGTGANAYNATATTLTKTTNGAFPSAVQITADSNGTDGVTLTTSDYVLLTNEASAANNGLWQITTLGSGAAPWVLTRATTLDAATEFTPGITVFTSQGDWYANTSWVLTATVATLGSSAVTFQKLDGFQPINWPVGSAAELISASGTVIINKQRKSHQIIRVAGNGAAVTASSTPFGSSAPKDGTVVTVLGTHDDNTVTLVHNDAAKGLMLNGDRTLGKNESLTAFYDAQTDRYIEVSGN